MCFLFYWVAKPLHSFLSSGRMPLLGSPSALTATKNVVLERYEETQYPLSAIDETEVYVRPLDRLNVFEHVMAEAIVINEESFARCYSAPSYNRSTGVMVSVSRLLLNEISTATSPFALRAFEEAALTSIQISLEIFGRPDVENGLLGAVFLKLRPMRPRLSCSIVLPGAG